MTTNPASMKILKIPANGMMQPMSHCKLLWLFVSLSVFLSGESVLAGLVPTALRCEYRNNPLGIDDTQQRLSWQVKSDRRGQSQGAWRILVASSKDLLKQNIDDLWDSGRVINDETVNIVYAGKPLASGQECFWKVRVWDKSGNSQWSEPASWSMGLL